MMETELFKNPKLYSHLIKTYTSALLKIAARILLFFLCMYDMPAHFQARVSAVLPYARRIGNMFDLVSRSLPA